MEIKNYLFGSLRKTVSQQKAELRKKVQLRNRLNYLNYLNPDKLSKLGR